MITTSGWLHRFGIMSRILQTCASTLVLANVATAGESPAPVKWRVIEPWHDPAGRQVFTHGGSIMSWDGMLHLRPDTPLGQYLGQFHEWGFNGIALGCDPDDNPEAFRAFCQYLKPMGISVFIRRDWHEIETGKSWPLRPSDGRPRTSPKLNPFSAEVRAYWEQRITRDYELFPEIAGYRMSGTEFYFCNGAPWMGEGPEMVGKTGRECVRAALQLVANELGKHSGTLFWETCQDDGWGQRQELWYFRDLTGEIPANAFILIKDHYWDYHPGWPLNPLDYVITRDAQGNSPYLTSIQLPGEYTGVNDFPWCHVDEIAGTMKEIVATGQQGIWVVALPLPKSPWDHPLNVVNWYAVSELMKNPLADPQALKMAWAKAEYGEAAANTVVDILTKVTEASRGIYEFDTLFSGIHSRFPSLPYLDSHLCGPIRQATRMKGMMGVALPLDMYPPEVAAQIRANPQTRLVFNQVPITARLKSEAMAQKDGAVQRMNEAIALWQALRGKLDEARYTQILAGLKGNLNDTIAFQHMMDLYMDWKLGTLTDAKIDAALAACQGLKGIAVPELLDPDPKKVTSVEPASLKTFAEELRRELRQPSLEEYWRLHPNPHVTYLP